MENKTSKICPFHIVNVTKSQVFASLVGYSVLGVVGIIGNLIVVFVYYGGRQSITRTLIFSLAIADLITCMVVLPLDNFRSYSKHFISGSFPFEHVVLHSLSGLRDVAFGVEGTILSCIAVDRFWSICYHHKRSVVTPLRVGLVILATTVCITGCEGSVVIVHVYFDPECLYTAVIRDIILNVYIALSFFSMLLLGVLYVKIFYTVHQQDVKNKSRRPASVKLIVQDGAVDRVPGSKGAVTMRSRRTALMLFASTIVFYATQFPVILSHLKLIPEGPHHKLYYINNAGNVIIYSLLNPEFRKLATQRLQKCCNKQ